ncbi:MAG: HAD family hydrolase [Leptospiraceae bacterium]|nr:HAD family hydrolase [Leptospiraceae bacterium]MCP5493075.1 HAD family hydrolase [Leptospiraceae bacterium]
MNKALFLDRDGIINIDTHYVHKIEDFVFIQDIFPLCRFFFKKGYQIFVITNQAGIARKYYTEADFHILTNYMINEFSKLEIPIQKVYFCPHHPTEGLGEYKTKCNCRKPAPGMILQAKQEFPIDLSSSVLVGDKESDIIAGLNAKVATNMLVSPQKPSITLPENCFHFASHQELLDYLCSVWMPFGH